MEYVAFVRATGKQWEIEFPDCDGCVSVADTEEELAAFLQRRSKGWLEAVLETGRSAPHPTANANVRPKGATLVRVLFDRDSRWRSRCAGRARTRD